MIKNFFWIILLFFFLNTQVFAAIYDYNIASVKVNVFNNWLPISTWNVAWVQVKWEFTMSWSVIVSDSSFNTATIKTQTFNNGLPISTWRVAKVAVDKTIWTWTGFNIKNDNYYNIATIRTQTFNNWLPISTWRVAKVEVDIDDFSTGATVVENDVFYNIATARSLVFNSWLPITTWRTAKVEIDYTIWAWTWFLYWQEQRYNIASVRTLVFNNWLPINTWRSAKVLVNAVESKVDEYIEHYDVDNNNTIRQIFRDENWNITYSWSTINYSTTGSFNIEARELSTNSKNYVYLWYNSKVWLEVTELYNNDWNFKKINKSNQLVHWDNWYYQKIIKTKNDWSKLDFWDQLKITKKIIWEELRYIRQNVDITEVPLPPILTYPYYFKDSQNSYILRNENSVIKWLWYPNSTLKVELDWKTYYVQVNSEWMFEFRPDKLSTTNWDLLIKFQYEMLNWNYTNYLLAIPTSYTLKVRTNESFQQPYLLNIYNDDDIYSDVVYLEWYANPGVLNYRFRNILNQHTILEWQTIVWDDKKFELLVLDKDKLIPWNDYIVEVWNDWWLKERKAFSLKWNTKDKIWIINFKDYETSITSRPVIIWYSKLSILNNDTIRWYACEIWSWIIINKCPEDKRILLWTTNADENGLFVFRTLKDLQDGKIYMINLYNTSNMDYHKNIILKVDLNNSDNIFRSEVLNIYNNLTLSNQSITIQWHTLKNSSVELYNSSNSNIATLSTNDFWYFEWSFTLPNDWEFIIKFTNWIDSYIKKFKLNYDENFVNQNNWNNYYLNFKNSNFEILEKK